MFLGFYYAIALHQEMQKYKRFHSVQKKEIAVLIGTCHQKNVREVGRLFGRLF
jgi:hypothetical protein